MYLQPSSVVLAGGIFPVEADSKSDLAKVVDPPVQVTVTSPVNPCQEAFVIISSMYGSVLSCWVTFISNVAGLLSHSLVCGGHILIVATALTQGIVMANIRARNPRITIVRFIPFSTPCLQVLVFSGLKTCMDDSSRRLLFFCFLISDAIHSSGCGDCVLFEA